MGNVAESSPVWHGTYDACHRLAALAGWGWDDDGRTVTVGACASLDLPDGTTVEVYVIDPDGASREGYRFPGWQVFTRRVGTDRDEVLFEANGLDSTKCVLGELAWTIAEVSS